MLEQIKITNFQCHSQFEMDFDPSVVSLTGRSDSGKSSVLRALRWVCTNKPAGTSFIKHGAEFAKVRLVVDGHVIVRKRSKTENFYSLDGKKFQAIGSEVPAEIADLLNVGDVNFAKQHDAPFWFSDTPGQVSRNLNSIVNLDIIDSTLANVASQLSKARTSASLTEERLRTAMEKAKELEWLPKLDADLTKLQGLERELAEKRLALARLGAIVADAHYHAKAVDNATRASQGVISAVTAGSQALAIHQTVEDLRRLLEKAVELAKLLERQPPNLTRLDVLKQQAESATTKRKGLADLLTKLNNAEGELCQLRKDHQSAIEDLNKKMAGQCPVCQQLLPKATARPVVCA